MQVTTLCNHRAILIVPDTFHHMSNAGSLLLRIGIECRDSDTVFSDRALELAKTYCETLADYWRDEQWDMADETLKRLAEPAFTAGKDCRGAREIYLTISNALGYHIAGKSKQRTITDCRRHGMGRHGIPKSLWFHQ